MYANENKKKLAENLYKKCIRFIKRKLPNDKDYLFSVYNLLAEVLIKEEKFNQANSLYKETLVYHSKIGSKNSVISSSFNIAENYIKLSLNDSARYYLHYAKTSLDEGHIYNSKYHEISSHILILEKKYDDAILEAKKSLEFTKAKLGIQKNHKIARSYLELGKIYSKANNNEKAIEIFKEAMSQFDDSGENDNTINQTIKLKILKNKTSALNNLKKYSTTLQTTDQAIVILDSLKPSFKDNSDKLFLIENAFPLFENGIEAAYKLFKKTENVDYIDKAFLYSEKSKSTLLLESLLSSKATKFANVPDKLIEKEKQLKAKINYLEKRNNSKPTAKLKDELFDLKQKHRQFIDSIEINYKGYYNLKYNTNVLTLQKLQNRLDDDTALLSYFYGNYSIYAVTVTKTSKYINKIPVDTKLETLLKDTYELLSNPNSNLTVLNSKTNKLYQKLVENSLALNPKRKLIIVPDGLLNYLPFESLRENSGNYLIESKVISYVNSVTLLNQLQAKTNTDSNEFLAFAPNFENSKSSTLLPLPNNKKEVEQLLTYFKGKTYTDANATLENFIKNYKKSEIIHLATHAIIDDENPEYSYLAFSKNSENENLLYTSDIYNLELNANMVTLSACESGIGNIKRGEGMLSLARGFYFSGTSSIASTLWKVNDASSSKLMDYFYDNLSKGKLKNEALQQGKVKFLEINKDNALSHPYYWSGFIISGNTDALNTSYNLIYIAGIALLIITVVLGLFIYKRKH